MPRIKGGKYNKTYVRKLKDGLRCDGKSVVEVCQEWGISRTTYYYWVENHPEFKTAHEYGERDCAAWWQVLARKAAAGEIKANAGIICFAMKNVEGVNWADKIETKSTVDEQIRQINISILPPPQEIKLLPIDGIIIEDDNES